MKKILLLAALATLFCYTTQAQNIQSALNYCVFNKPGTGPYVETYLMVRGETARFVKNANGKYQGNVEVTLTASRGDSVFYADKYNLLSPEIADTTGTIPNFIDKHTLPLKNGNYSLELSIADLNRTAPAHKGSMPLAINYATDAVAISDIMTVESFEKTITPNALTKSGYDLVPYVSTYYPQQFTEFVYYTEVYNTDKKFGANQKFVVNTYIESADKKQPLDNFYTTKVYTAQPATVLFSSFDIRDLPSGNYNFVVEVRDSKNELVAIKRLFIQRSSDAVAPDLMTKMATNQLDFASYVKSLPTDTLREYVRSLRPIANVKERNFIDNQAKKIDSISLQNYFVNFWEQHTPDNQFKGWAQYLNQVHIVNSFFGTSIKPGYQTDRGRVFLQYGAPNSRNISLREPSAYPYEVWQYYRIGNQNNRRFVFYNPDLVTNDYILLHSDALGEMWDDQWQVKLHKRDTQPNNFDINNVNPSYGNQSRDLFNTPR